MGTLKDAWNLVAWRLRGRSAPETWRVTVPRIPGFRYNEVLRDDAAIEEAIHLLGWTHPTRPKSWDFLKAAHFLQARFSDQNARVLDAGCVGSPILEWLYGRGFRRLVGVDLSGNDLPAVPGLIFRRASITATPFPDRFFDVMTCISVIEHGVDLDAFLSEAVRILRPGGALLLSTDYSAEPVDTTDVPTAQTFGLPWTVFDRAGIERLIARARSAGLEPVDPVRWDAAAPPVRWNGKRYTFIFLAFTLGPPRVHGDQEEGRQGSHDQ